MVVRKRTDPKWLILAFALLLLLTSLARIQLPPVDEEHHAWLGHKWTALRAYMNVSNMDPNDFDPSERSGHYDCLDGSFLDIVFDGDLYNLVISGIEAQRSFVYTSYTSTNEAFVDRKIARCTGG